MKQKWYKSWWGVILLLIFFFPFGLYQMWKATNWNRKVKWGITAYFVLSTLGFIALINADVKPSSQQEVASASSENTKPTVAAVTNTSAPTNTPTPKTASAPAKAHTSTPKPTTIPTKAPEKKAELAKQAPEQILEDICKKYGGANNCYYEKDAVGSWSITQLIQPEEDFMLFTTAKQISRDYIFAVYASKLPIIHTSITVNSNGKYYRAGLGADVADTQPDSTWTSKDVGPTIFYDFLKSSTNGSAGDGLNSTYVETNLD